MPGPRPAGRSTWRPSAGRGTAFAWAADQAASPPAYWAPGRRAGRAPSSGPGLDDGLLREAEVDPLAEPVAHAQQLAHRVVVRHAGEVVVALGRDRKARRVFAALQL